MSEPIHIISLGAGVQSSTKALQASESMIPNFQQWHDLYLSLSPYPVAWDIAANARYENLWGRAKPQPTIDDLRLVLKFIRHQVKAGKRRRESFRLYNLLDPDRFLYDLSDAKAELRVKERQPRIDPARKSVLEATGRKVEIAMGTPVHVSNVDWIAEMRKAVNG